jgi:hypothetical protein
MLHYIFIQLSTSLEGKNEVVARVMVVMTQTEHYIVLIIVDYDSYVRTTDNRQRLCFFITLIFTRQSSLVARGSFN